MKKTLALALAATLAVSAAAPAQAASLVDFNGYYRAYYLSDTNLGRRADSFTDSYFGHRLNMDVTFSPTDELSVYWRLRGPDFRRWGSEGNLDLSTYHIYGEIKQDWGTTLVGRLDEDLDVYGLATLGYLAETNPIFTTVGPFEEAGVMDAVRFTREWDSGWYFMAQYGKISNNSSDSDLPDNRHSDQDFDRYQVEGAYRWDGGGVSLGMWYDRDATIFDADDPGADKFTGFYLNPAFMQSWGDFSVHFEGLAGWGQEKYVGREPDQDAKGYAFYLDADYNYGDGNVTLAGWWVSGSGFNESDSKSLVGLGGNFFPLIVAYNANSSGFGRVDTVGYTDPENGNAIYLANTAYENYIHVGYQHTPGYLNTGGRIGISTAAEGLLANPAFAGRSRTDQHSFNNETEANHWALALSGNHALTDDISLHYALAYLALNKPNYRVANSWSGLYDAGTAAEGTIRNGGGVSYLDQDKDLGFEIDLGFSFQLLDNLEFTTAFGYMFTGDAYKTLRGYNQTGGGADGANTYTDGKAVWEDGKDTYTWYNTLTFNF